MAIQFVDLKRQYLTIKEEVGKAMQDVMDNTSFVLGKPVETFEKNFAKYCGTKYAIGVASGTDALFLALKAAGIKAGDEVITAPNSFIATAAAISHTGAAPVFVDVEEASFNIDPKRIEKAITPKTKAIIPVHLYGQPADMDPVNEIAEKHDLVVIEDACQAHGALYKGRRTGSLGAVGCFSFYPGKNLGAFGEGGMITTDDSEIANVVRELRDQGQERKYFHNRIGFNSRLHALQAAVLDVKLKHLDSWNEKRRKNAELYAEELGRIGIAPPEESEYAKHIYHLYVARVQKRDALIEFLKKNDIFASIHYPVPIHLQKAYAPLGLKRGSFPITEKMADEIVSLPMFPELKEEEIRLIAQKIKEFLKR